MKLRPARRGAAVVLVGQNSVCVCLRRGRNPGEDPRLPLNRIMCECFIGTIFSTGFLSAEQTAGERPNQKGGGSCVSSENLCQRENTEIIRIMTSVNTTDGMLIEGNALLASASPGAATQEATATRNPPVAAGFYGGGVKYPL